MKKQSLWLIVGVMLTAFVGLLYMQVGYIRVVYMSRNAQFDSSVRRALSEVSANIERDEIARAVNEELGIPAPMVQDLLKHESSKNSPGQGPFQYFRPPNQKSALPPNVVTEQDRITELSKLLQDEMTDRYRSIRQMVVQLALEVVRDRDNVPLYERMTSQQLETYLGSYLQRMGITLPYIYEVVGCDGQVYFSTGNVPQDSDYAVYSQALFGNDRPSRLHYLRVYFPGKRQYISSTIDFLIPSVIFTILLFITFAYSIANLFRQKKLEEMRKDFINNMTHELKTPVSSILIGTSLLYDEDLYRDEERRQRTLSSITAEGNRLNLLIEKVLQMSFFDGSDNRLALKLTEVDMEELVINVTSIFSLKVENANGILDVDLNAQDTMVHGDEMHLTNIIFNLLDNAMKYRRPDVAPIIRVETGSDKNDFIIRISDNGQGIKREYLKKIFDRFFRVPTGDQHNVKGFGLGLAYVARMVRSHNGTISAESKIDVGTTFEIKIPLLKPDHYGK